MSDRHLKLLLTILTIGTILIACTTNDNRASNQENSESKNEEQKDPSGDNETQLQKSGYEGGDFVLVENIETFRQRFNSFLQEATSSLVVRQVTIHEGKPSDPGKAFEYAFSDHLYVVGGLNKKDNSVRTLSIALENTDSATDIGDFLVTILATIATTNPELKPEERGDILKEIGLMDTQKIGSQESWTGKTVKNGTQFNIAYIYGQGFIFNAERPNN